MYCFVDSTDCIIQELMPFSLMCYSHKFHRPGVEYKIAISNNWGQMVWVDGSFPCIKCPDLKKFKNQINQLMLALMRKLLPTTAIIFIIASRQLVFWIMINRFMLEVVLDMRYVVKTRNLKSDVGYILHFIGLFRRIPFFRYQFDL